MTIFNKDMHMVILDDLSKGVGFVVELDDTHTIRICTMIGNVASGRFEDAAKVDMRDLTKLGCEVVGFLMEEYKSTTLEVQDVAFMSPDTRDKVHSKIVNWIDDVMKLVV
jgi:hypothetical protein